MNNTINKIAKQIRDITGKFNAETLIILGSGLGSIADAVKNPIIIPYEEIDGFPQSTVSGHQGRLVIGKLEGKNIFCMQGRIHLYEGHSPQSINMIIKVFQSLGVKNLIVTNASGSLNTKMPAGSIMLINDHINFSGTNPLIGANDHQFGPRFPDMSNAYTAEYRDKIKAIAKKNKIKIFEGVYLMVLGPNFETAAEIRAFQILGANAVGMSTVPEVISGAHSGMKILGLSAITNLGTGLQKSSQNHEDTLSQGQKASQNLAILIKEFIREI